MEFRILGPLDVIEDGRTVELGGAKQRALLAVLLLSANRVVSSDALIDALWEEQQPEKAQRALHVLVSQLRKTLGSERIVTRAPGYLLRVETAELDLERFQHLVAEGGVDRLREALALWRGAPLAEFAFERFAQSEIAKLEALREVVLEQRIEADLERGGHTGLIGELESLVAEHPVREQLRVLLMLALYRSGRQADALAAYQGARRALVEELGLEPGRALRELEQAILRQDPVLDPPSRVDPAPLASPDVAKRRASMLVIIGGLAVLVAAVSAAVVLSHRGSARIVEAVPNSVAVIDPRTNRLVGDTPVGDTPTTVAVGDGSVWVLNSNEQTLSRIDPESRAVLRVIPAASASDMAVSAGTVWMATTKQTLAWVDPGVPLITHTVGLPPPPNPLLEAGSPSRVAVRGQAVWATTTGGVWRIRPSPRRRFPVAALGGGGPLAIGLGSIWVAGQFGLERLNAGTGAFEADIKLPFVGSSLAVGAHGVWVSDQSTDRVWFIDPKINAVDVSIPVGKLPSAVAIGDGSVWVASGDGTVSQIDPNTDQVTSTIVVGGTPSGIAVGAGKVWVAVD